MVIKCKCLTPERIGFIKSADDCAIDFSDESFMALMEERGITADELEVFSHEHQNTCKKK